MHPPKNMLLILIATVATSLSFLVSHAVQLRPAGACIPHEREALLGFKRGIMRDPAGLLSSWQESNEDCCRWSGVRCSNQTGHVLRLELSNKHVVGDYYHHWMITPMVGQISHSLIFLEHLEYLDLSWNNLIIGSSGCIPVFLGSLKNIKYLNLSGIPFSGEVPSHLGNLSNLRYLDLSYTGFTYSRDVSWIRHLHFLQYLNLGRVNLSTISDWPYVVNMIPSLRVLDLSGCSLTSASQRLPHLNLTILEKLDLSHNYFYHPIASCWFWNNTYLKHLDLQSTSLYGPFPSALQEMTSLKFLAISQPYDSKPASKIMTSLRNLCNLEILYIQYSNLLKQNITEILESLPNCSSNKLRELDLSANNISGQLPNRMRHLTSLELLDLSDNKISGVLPNWMGQLTSLEHLDLSDTKISGVLPNWMGQLTSLELLDLSENKISGALPKWLGKLLRLEVLDLSGNKISGSLPKWLGKLTRLEYLRLSSNDISGVLPNQMEKLTNLTDLYVNSNNLTGPVPSFIGQLTSLGYLDLSYNHLTGLVPSEIGMLSNLRELYLNNNGLYGVITEEHFAGLKSLRWLEMGSNSLSIVTTSDWQPPFLLRNAGLASCQMGPQFPSWLKWMVDIGYLNISNTGINDRLPHWFSSTFSGAIYLDISNNQIHGRLPTNMENMSLDRLYLSSNQLTGPIPPLPINLTTLDLSNNFLSGPLI